MPKENSKFRPTTPRPLVYTPKSSRPKNTSPLPNKTIRKTLTGQRTTAVSLHMLPAPRPESTHGYVPLPPKQHKRTLAQVRFPSNTYSESRFGSQEPQPRSHLQGWWSPIWRESQLSAYRNLRNRDTPRSCGDGRSQQARQPLLAGEPGLHPAEALVPGAGASPLAPTSSLHRAVFCPIRESW